jgi:hypothetical protein
MVCTTEQLNRAACGQSATRHFTPREPAALNNGEPAKRSSRSEKYLKAIAELHPARGPAEQLCELPQSPTSEIAGRPGEGARALSAAVPVPRIPRNTKPI